LALAAEKGAKALAEPAAPSVDVKQRRARIEVLTLRNESLAGALTKAGLLNAKG
jgi:hypothetical protein